MDSANANLDGQELTAFFKSVPIIAVIEAFAKIGNVSVIPNGKVQTVVLESAIKGA